MLLKMKDALGSFGKLTFAHSSGGWAGWGWRSGRCPEMGLGSFGMRGVCLGRLGSGCREARGLADRKSTRLNSSHLVISYAVFCLIKKQSAQDLGRCHHQLADAWFYSQRAEDRVLDGV